MNKDDFARTPEERKIATIVRRALRNRGTLNDDLLSDSLAKKLASYFRKRELDTDEFVARIHSEEISRIIDNTERQTVSKITNKIHKWLTDL